MAPIKGFKEYVKRNKEPVKPNENLKSVLEFLEISNLALAKALDLDPSLISRYLSGERRLFAASAQMNAIADFIIKRCDQLRDIQWLTDQFHSAGLLTDVSATGQFKQNLILWLASDGEILRKHFGLAKPVDIGHFAPREKNRSISTMDEVQIGGLSIVSELFQILQNLPQKSVIDIFISNDRIGTITNQDISNTLLKQIEKNDLHVRMIVCVSGDTQAMSQILNTYISALVSGHIRLSVIFAVTQTVINQMTLLIPDRYVLIITETNGGTAPPVAVPVRNSQFITDMGRNFEMAWHYGQPLLKLYDDNFSRNILEILFTEFCSPGPLDVVKDSINPMYMPVKAYDRFLKTRGHHQDEFSWRSAEFARFKKGMDNVLAADVPFREILSMSRLHDIVSKGSCRMAGLYFMERGYIDLDTEGCIAILNGYIEYLKNVPNFNLVIVDDLNQLHRNNCWQLKQNHHLAINYWNGPEPIMIYSNQIMLLREFQTHFEMLWEQGQKSLPNRANVIAILQNIIDQLIENFGTEQKDNQDSYPI